MSLHDATRLWAMPPDGWAALRWVRVTAGSNGRLDRLDGQRRLPGRRERLAGELGLRDLGQAAIVTHHFGAGAMVRASLAGDVQRLVEARRTASDKVKEQRRDAVRPDRLSLCAPMDGVVQALFRTKVGQLVKLGQEVMRLVLPGASLQVLAYVIDENIGFVRVGQVAAVKVSSSPFTRFGTIEAEVVQMAHDVPLADTANHAVTDAARAGSATPVQLSATPMTDMVFEAILRPSRLVTTVDGRDVPLQPGMTVAVEVETEQIRVLEYLFSPLIKVITSAGRKR